MQCKVAEELFQLHFQEQRDITDMQTVIDAGEAAGLDKIENSEYLDDGAIRDIVDKEAQKARDDGVSSSVPQFSLQGGKYTLDGAQGAMDFFEVFMKIKEEGPNDRNYFPVPATIGRKSSRLFECIIPTCYLFANSIKLIIPPFPLSNRSTCTRPSPSPQLVQMSSVAWVHSRSSALLHTVRVTESDLWPSYADEPHPHSRTSHRKSRI